MDITASQYSGTVTIYTDSGLLNISPEKAEKLAAELIAASEEARDRSHSRLLTEPEPECCNKIFSDKNGCEWRCTLVVVDRDPHKVCEALKGYGESGVAYG